MTLSLLRSEPGKKWDREYFGQGGQQMQKHQGSKGLVWMRNRKASAGGAERQGGTAPKGWKVGGQGPTHAGGAVKLRAHRAIVRHWKALSGKQMITFVFLKDPSSLCMENRWGGRVWGKSRSGKTTGDILQYSR